jgi:hypothetical protein
MSLKVLPASGLSVRCDAVPIDQLCVIRSRRRVGGLLGVEGTPASGIEICCYAGVPRQSARLMSSAFDHSVPSAQRGGLYLSLTRSVSPPALWQCKQDLVAHDASLRRHLSVSRMEIVTGVSFSVPRAVAIEPDRTSLAPRERGELTDTAAGRRAAAPAETGIEG